MGRIRFKFRSMPVAAFLLALLLLQLLLMAVIPQQGMGGAGRFRGAADLMAQPPGWLALLHLDRIYQSLLFRATLLLLAAHIIYGNVCRVRNLLRPRSRRERLRRLGSVVFHLGLLVVIGGVFLNSACRTDAVFGLTVGQTVRDIPTDRLDGRAGPWARAATGRFVLKLERLQVATDATGAPDAEATILIGPPDGGSATRGTVSFNNPFRWRGLAVRIGAIIGYSPEIVVIDTVGGTCMRRFVRMAATPGPDGKLLHRDFIDAPCGGLGRLRLTMERDAASPDDVRLVLGLRDGDRWRDHRLAVGDTLAAGGVRITSPRLRRWCHLSVTGDPWLNLVFGGFWTALAGLGLVATAAAMKVTRNIESLRDPARR